jgi:hypothetical protein
MFAEIIEKAWLFKALERLDSRLFVLFLWGSSPEGLARFYVRIADL